MAIKISRFDEKYKPIDLRNLNPKQDKAESKQTGTSVSNTLVRYQVHHNETAESQFQKENLKSFRRAFPLGAAGLRGAWPPPLPAVVCAHPLISMYSENGEPSGTNVTLPAVFKL